MDDQTEKSAERTNSMRGSAAGSSPLDSNLSGHAPVNDGDGRKDHYLPPESTTEDLDYTTVPPGSYVCRIEEARARFTKGGDRLWALKWVVDEGPETGRIGAWDNVVFSLRAAPRTRQILRALGLPTEGAIRLGSADFVGRRAIVEIATGYFEHPGSGKLVTRNEVTYDGVRLLEDGNAAAGPGATTRETSEDGSEIPF